MRERRKKIGRIVRGIEAMLDFAFDHRPAGRGRAPHFNHRSPCLLNRRKIKMDVNSSVVLPPATGIICLVDDDPSMLRALDRLLSSDGLQARLFSEPLAFLSYVICHSVALAVIDIWMSGMSGLQVQKKLQAVLPKTRVIIITATDENSVRNAAIQGGAIAYFVKPFDDEAFLAAVHQALASES
jgi:CheY-like chemotaxis protein